MGADIMSLASKRWVNNRLGKIGRPGHPRRILAAGGAGGITTDYVFVGGKKLEISQENQTNFLKVYLDGVTSPAWVEAMPETQDSNTEVFDVTKNRIHLPGNFA